MRGHEPGWVCAFQLRALAVILFSVELVQMLYLLHKYPKLPEEAMDGRS